MQTRDRPPVAGSSVEIRYGRAIKEWQGSKNDGGKELSEGILIFWSLDTVMTFPAYSTIIYGV